MSLWAAAQEPVYSEALSAWVLLRCNEQAGTQAELAHLKPLERAWFATRMVCCIIWAGLAASGSRASGLSQGRTRSSVD